MSQEERADDTLQDPVWRSLDELEQAPDFEEWLHREFPRQAAVWPEGLDRRGFLTLSGASLALAGLTACTKQPLEKIVPWGEQLEYMVPGVPLYFATALTLDGYATGVLAESHEGRPTKIEGNPDHPASLGATDAFHQAAILGLYDPDRSKNILQLGRIRTWSSFVDETQRATTALRALEGGNLRFLTETVTSPSLAAQIRGLLETYPGARWVQYDPASSDEHRAATASAYGAPAETGFDLWKADRILALDTDFLSSGPGCVANARAFAERRRPENGEMNRMYCLESTTSTTGSMADHRRAVPTDQVATFAVALGTRLGVPGASGGATLEGELNDWLEAVAADLESHRGRCLVVAGEQTSADLQLLVLAINEHLGNRGETLLVTESVEAEPVQQTDALTELVADMNAGEVDVLVVIGGNPVYNAPAELGFAEAMLQVNRRIHLGLYDDETAEYCQWHVPMAHELESWGDARSQDGTTTIIQPLIEPLYSGHTAGELLSIFEPDGPRESERILKDYWAANSSDGDFDAAWRTWLHDGMIPGSAASPLANAFDSSSLSAATARLSAASHATVESPELTLRPDPAVWDGRFSNNAWLQECPRPLTKLTWDNGLMVSPAFATARGLETGSMVRVAVGERSVDAAVWVNPGQADATVTLHLGYGRTRAGGVGNQTGFDAYRVRTAETRWQADGVQLDPTGETYELVSTQMHQNMELETRESGKRHLVRAADLETFEHEPDFAQHMGHKPADDMTLFPAWEYDGNAWGMAIDLNACTGCSACVIACQAENNIPVVGKDQVALGREMHWIRIDRYYHGELSAPAIHHQPVMCMHCEQAPCEVVCPVAATVHSDEGLNDMVYNRCVGTRYCANNCPYKVRRFNFLLYSDFETPVLDLMRNPDVTVRSRGVMEKCSYCVQRINKVKIAARRDDRPIVDGEIRTACQDVCPSEAIIFGDINDESSKVAKAKAQDRNYGILEDLNTRPRTTYLAKVSNPNPALAHLAGASAEDAHH